MEMLFHLSFDGVGVPRAGFEPALNAFWGRGLCVGLPGRFSAPAGFEPRNRPLRPGAALPFELQRIELRVPGSNRGPSEPKSERAAGSATRIERVGGDLRSCPGGDPRRPAVQAAHPGRPALNVHRQERMTRIELVSSVWKTVALPLSYTRVHRTVGVGRESNPRRLRRPPLPAAQSPSQTGSPCD
jgi:hypothetical protein